MKLSEIAKLIGAEVDSGPDTEIKRVAKIEEAGPGDITFLSNLKYRKFLATTSASAVIIGKEIEFKELRERTSPLHCVIVADPYAAFLRLVEVFHPAPAPLPPGIHPSAVVAPSASLGPNVAVGAHVVIGENCRIGANATIYHGTVLGDNTEVGEGSLLYANVTVRESCKLGRHAIVHSGAVIGSDGFGFAPKPDKTYEKIPQRGCVVIEDDVEIGANCTIDRATIGETRIKRGAKLDNLIHVAHNVVIGENTVIAGQAGISGSTKIGDNCLLAGQVGLVGHITIADGTTIGAQSGVSRSITEPGKTYFGSPVKELQRALRVEASLQQLPELLVEIHRLQERVQQLERDIKEHLSKA
jgi:UDP-3-O-[3-hydroxymyristoyl] glucosamine N-acyltransferase